VCDVFTPHVKEFRETGAIPNYPAILFMDNYSRHLVEPFIDLLSKHKVKIITFRLICLVFYTYSISYSLESLRIALSTKSVENYEIYENKEDLLISDRV
jgi:hypothetical protein